MSSGKRRRARVRIAVLEREERLGDLIGNERRRERRLQSRKPPGFVQHPSLAESPLVPKRDQEVPARRPRIIQPRRLEQRSQVALHILVLIEHQVEPNLVLDGPRNRKQRCVAPERLSSAGGIATLGGGPELQLPRLRPIRMEPNERLRGACRRRK